VKVTDILRFARERGDPVFSFEFFPPRTDEGERQLFLTVEALRPLGPAFVSVTYGAGGSERARTIDLVKRLKRDAEVEPVAHVTCVGSPRDDVAHVLDEVAEAGIQNVLLLRGDPPRGETAFTPHPDGFPHASDLVAYVRSQGSRWGFCVGAAAYPEGHPETRDLSRDLANLKLRSTRAWTSSSPSSSSTTPTTSASSSGPGRPASRCRCSPA
jgi:methylenetetrahydrofolate reductase (NADPH)